MNKNTKFTNPMKVITGILVDCQGYDYARYAADVRDKTALNLRNVPIDHLDLKLRQPRRQQER